MVDKLIGTWMSVSSENFNTFLDAAGASQALKAVAIKKSTVTISREDGGWKLVRTVGDNTIQMVYPLGQEVEITSFSGKKMKAALIEEPGRLIETIHMDFGKATVVLSADNNELLTEIFFKDSFATVTWQRV
ncbi:fatty acid-binding protein 12-like [Pomacea canaliculata]|uniref:fatty acid-binding protein 12-like n=1 Tax=Pomacea canaliculata TaxID=400727 RepID=UPI000D727DD7|nr:fatty acid-binding protein 12-like [Pomacea canaliculata]